VDEPSQELCQSLQELEKASAKNTGRGYWFLEKLLTYDIKYDIIYIESTI
jgi:hypothetical protein